MLETSSSSQSHEGHLIVSSEEAFPNEKEALAISKNSINYLSTNSNFPSVKEYINISKSSNSMVSLPAKSANPYNYIFYQNTNNSRSSRSLTNKLPLNTSHKMTLGKARRAQNSSMAPGFPTKAPEIKKKPSSAPPEEVKSLEIKIELVKKRLRSMSFTENEKEFDKLENDILKDVKEVTKSIDKVLEDRKEIQLEHRRWLEDRKRKILETKKNTKIIKDSNSHLF